MFEQDLINFLNNEVSIGNFIHADLTGVNELNFVGEAIVKVLNTSNNTIEEKKIFLFKQNDIIVYRIIGFSTEKEKILLTIPRREADLEEGIPNKEIINEGNNKYIQIRYDFYEHFEDNTRYFYFKYIDVLDEQRNTIINTLIRSRYTQEQENAILRKKLFGLETLDFLKFNNWVKYSKAVADGLDLNTIKNEKIYEIIIPLNLCNLGYDYGGLAFQTLIKSINFESNVIENTGKAYPAWISDSDMILLNSDSRISVSQINLYVD